MADDETLGMSRDAADALARAKARRELAEAVAVAEKGKLEAMKLKLEVDLQKIRNAKEKRLEELELAKDAYHFVYTFTETVGIGSVQKCIEQLAVWDRTGPRKELEIVFTSPGGDVISGMRLFDYICWLRKKGHKVTTAALGEAASMAGILLQAGDHRIMGKECWVLIHEAAFGGQGKTGEMEDRVKWVKRIQDRIAHIFVERSQESECEEPLTVKKVKANWKKTDWWLSSDECLKYGIVDEVR